MGMEQRSGVWHAMHAMHATTEPRRSQVQDHDRLACERIKAKELHIQQKADGRGRQRLRQWLRQRLKAA